MYDQNGEHVWQRELDLNGNPRNLQADSSENCELGYQGMYFDRETELYYVRHRYFSAKDGRFISQDPIGLASGEYNFYAYVENPTIGVDIFGLANSYRRKNGQFGKKPGRKSKQKKNKGQPDTELLALAKRGREAHKNYENALPGNYRFEVTLDNGRRVDAIDFENNIVKELKPDTKSGITKGKKQLADYIKQLETQTGKKWTGFLDTYTP